MRLFKYNMELYDVKLLINILRMQCVHTVFRLSIVVRKKVDNN